MCRFFAAAGRRIVWDEARRVLGVPSGSGGATATTACRDAYGQDRPRCCHSDRASGHVVLLARQSVDKLTQTTLRPAWLWRRAEKGICAHRARTGLPPTPASRLSWFQSRTRAAVFFSLPQFAAEALMGLSGGREFNSRHSRCENPC